MKYLIASLLLAASPVAAHAADPKPLAGDYAGEIDVSAYGAGVVAMTIHAGPPPTVDVPSQGASGIPIELKQTGEKVSFTIPSVNASYEGVVSADGASISGEFSQMGLKIPVVYKKK